MTGLEYFGLLAAVGAIAAAYFLREIGRHNKRADQLRQAEAFLQYHNEAIGEFTASPDADADLRRYALLLSHALSDDDVVRRTAEMLLANRGKRVPRSRFGPLSDALTALGKQQPSLLILFVEAMEAGFLGAFLRVPETASRFHELVPLVVAGQGTAAQEAVQHVGHFKAPAWIGASLNGAPQAA